MPSKGSSAILSGEGEDYYSASVSDVASAAVRSSTDRSDAWNYFQVIEGTDSVKCLVGNCDAEIRYKFLAKNGKSKITTSSMWGHLSGLHGVGRSANASTSTSKRLQDNEPATHSVKEKKKNNGKDQVSIIYKTPSEVRLACRRGEFSSQTSGQAPGYAQANLVILGNKEEAFDFLLFCQRNPISCPLLEMLEAGQYMYGDIDIRTDLPKYCVYRDGVMSEEITDVSKLWGDTFYTFIIGCSFSFEDAMQRAGLGIRHVEQGCNVPMYRTNVPCRSAGRFHGNMVVSMRPFTPSDALKAARITSRYPRVHGGPVHIGSPVCCAVLLSLLYRLVAHVNTCVW